VCSLLWWKRSIGLEFQYSLSWWSVRYGPPRAGDSLTQVVSRLSSLNFHSFLLNNDNCISVQKSNEDNKQAVVPYDNFIKSSSSAELKTLSAEYVNIIIKFEIYALILQSHFASTFWPNYGPWEILAWEICGAWKYQYRYSPSTVCCTVAKFEIHPFSYPGPMTTVFAAILQLQCRYEWKNSYLFLRWNHMSTTSNTKIQIFWGKLEITVNS